MIICNIERGSLRKEILNLTKEVYEGFIKEEASELSITG